MGLARGQGLEPRLSVTSIEVLRKGVTQAPEDPGAPKNKIVLDIGERAQVKVRFQTSGSADPKKLSRDPMRLGLFLTRERGAIASVQRGTLLECKDRFCVGVFESNDEMQFYSDELKNFDKWFVQALQNPVLEERLIEAENEKSGPFEFKSIKLDLQYSRQAVVLDETSTTVFNSAKASKRASYGTAYKGTLMLDHWEISYANYSAVLGTRGFYAESFETKVRDRDIALAYVVSLFDKVSLGLSASRLDFDFVTTAVDEVLVSTQYGSWGLGAIVRYKLPYELFRFGGGNYVIDYGRGLVAFKKGLLSSANDVGEFKRGEKGKWTHWRLDFDHAFVLRSGRRWLNGTQLGVGTQYQNNANSFSGSASGFGVESIEGSSSYGDQFSWKFFIGREFVLR